MFSVDAIEKKNNSKYANIHKTNFCCRVGKILANKNLSNIYIYIYIYIYICKKNQLILVKGIDKCWSVGIGAF